MQHKASLQQQLDQMWCATIVAERAHSQGVSLPSQRHLAKDCWSKDPSKRPSGTPKTKPSQLPSLLLFRKGKEKAAEAK